MEKRYKLAFEKINNAGHILLVTHIRPDGDGLASVCAMAEILENMDKPYQAYCYDAPPIQYDFLPHLEKITSDKRKIDFSLFNVIVVLDCGDLGRTKLKQEILNRRPDQLIIELDHHPQVDDYADIEIRDPTASSTSEIVYNFIRANNIKITKRIANCILTGIATDTKFFFFPSTSDKTIDIASEMLKRGARLPPIVEYTWRNKSIAAMKVWGKAINNLRINKKYNLAYAVLTKEDLSNNNISTEELEGISELLSNMENVKAVMLLREEEGGKIRGNLRTNYPNIDVSALAQLLGGGGHPKASGFTIEGRLERIEKGWRVV